MTNFNYFFTPVGPEYKRKFARNVGIGVLILFAFYGMLSLAISLQDSKTNSTELECLRLYKDIKELSQTKEIQLAEQDALKKQKGMVMEYVSKGCPEFQNLDLLYDSFSKTP